MFFGRATHGRPGGQTVAELAGSQPLPTTTRSSSTPSWARQAGEGRAQVVGPGALGEDDDSDPRHATPPARPGLGLRRQDRDEVADQREQRERREQADQPADGQDSPSTTPASASAPPTTAATKARMVSSTEW